MKKPLIEIIKCNSCAHHGICKYENTFEGTDVNIQENEIVDVNIKCRKFSEKSLVVPRLGS